MQLVTTVWFSTT